MNLQPLYDVKSRLEQAAMAGAGLLGEDFRLQRAAEALKPLGAASPVFGKIVQGLEELLAAPAQEQGNRLLDVLALVNAVVYTQGVSTVPGELEPLPDGPRYMTCLPVSYGQLHPLLEALTGTGGGRMGVIQDTWEAHPEFFRDYRVLPALVRGLGESYAELAELNQKILTAQGKEIAPLLKEGLDPEGKREMARRVEVIAALEGAQATPWLLELLPRAKKDVRGAVIAGLGAGPDNAPLLLELVKTERGKSRQAALAALAQQDGEAVRAFWAQELETNREAVDCLDGPRPDWASDLLAAGLRERLERALGEDKKLSIEAQAVLRPWCSAAQGKDSPAMLDFWRWVDGPLDALAQASHVADPAILEERVCTCLLNGLCQVGSAPLCQTALELWERDRERPRWIGHAFLAAVLLWEPAAVYETFSPYIQVQQPLARTEGKRLLHEGLLKALGRLHWEERRYVFDYGLSRPISQTLDPRWIGRLTHAVWRKIDGKERKYLPFGHGEVVGGFDRDLCNLANPDDPETCTQLVPYLRRRMEVLASQGSWYTYSRWILRFHGQFHDLLPKVVGKGQQKVYLYYVWQLFQLAFQDGYPPEQLAEGLEAVLASGALRAEDKELGRKAIPHTVVLLRGGRPFPEWSDWWDMR